jgi:hypothetical protein
MELDILQWPAMVATIVASGLVASRNQRRRGLAFWCFVLSNVLWTAWGWSAGAYAVIALQIALFALNVRGILRNEG